MKEFFEGHSFILIMLSIGTAFSIIWLNIKRKSLGVKLPGALLMAFTHTIYGVFTVMIFAVIEAWDFSVFGSFSLFGAVFLMPLYYFIVARILHQKVGIIFDVFIPCLLFTLMCARINCLYSGCCLGKLMSESGKLSGLRWPTREAEIIFYIVLIVIFILRILGDKNQGDLYPVYLISYGVFRFVIEFFRVSQINNGFFHLSHIWAMLAFLLGFSIILTVKEKERNASGNKKTRRIH